MKWPEEAPTWLEWTGQATTASKVNGRPVLWTLFGSSAAVLVLGALHILGNQARVHAVGYRDAGALALLVRG